MKKNAVILRASAMLALVGAVVVGATFALPTSSATLSNNTLATATTTLEVDGPDADSDFNATETGFQFKNLLPGATNFSAPQSFSLKNQGDTDLSIGVAKTGTPTGTLDPTKVHIKFTNTTATGNPSETYTLDQLATAKALPGVFAPSGQLDGNNPDTPAADGETNAFTVEVKVDEDATSNLTGFNLVFTGTAIEEVSTPL